MQFDRRFQTPEKRAEQIRMTFQEVAITDILTAEGGQISMRNFVLDFDPPTTMPSRRRAGTKLHVPFGMLDPTWSHRVGWMRWPGPVSRLLVFDRSDRVFGYGFNVRYQVLNTFDHFLYGKQLDRREMTALWPDRKIPLIVHAMALAENALFLAGPTDLKIIDHPEIYQKSAEPDFQETLTRQARLFSGDEGAVLWVVDRQDGKRLAEYRLERLPVFDGMALAKQSVFISTVDGRLIRMGEEVPKGPSLSWRMRAKR